MPIRTLSSFAFAATVLFDGASGQVLAAPPPDLERARAVAQSLGCDGPGTMAGDQLPETFALTEPPAYEDGPEREYTIYEVVCGMGAYNVSIVYLVDDGYDGPVPASFATPVLDIDYEDEEQTRVRNIAMNGFAATFRLINPSYDPETHTIRSAEKWRGLGDASSSGTWRFVDGRFVLERYTADPTYDGEITPELVFER